MVQGLRDAARRCPPEGARHQGKAGPVAALQRSVPWETDPAPGLLQPLSNPRQAISGTSLGARRSQGAWTGLTMFSTAGCLPVLQCLQPARSSREGSGAGPRPRPGRVRRQSPSGGALRKDPQAGSSQGQDGGILLPEPGERVQEGRDTEIQPGGHLPCPSSTLR